MNRYACWMSSLAAVVVLVFGMTIAHAQDASTGSIRGTITDSSGALVKGATVILINTDRNHVERTLTTSSGGFFTATALPLGTYTVKVSDGGFKTDAVTGLVLNVSYALTVNRTLIAGNASETITVTAEQARVNLEDATSAGLIN